MLDPKMTDREFAPKRDKGKAAGGFSGEECRDEREGRSPFSVQHVSW